MNTELLEIELRRDEGVRHSIYADTSGIPTCGVGHNCATSPLPADWATPLSEAQINQLLAQDMASTISKLDCYLPWWKNLDDTRQRVFANMAFNLGISGFLEFRNMLAAAKCGDYVLAASEMLKSKWARQVGNRARRLALAMRSGVMPN